MVSSGNFLCGLILFSSLLSVLGTLRFMCGPVVLLSPPPTHVYMGVQPDDLAWHPNLDPYLTVRFETK